MCHRPVELPGTVHPAPPVTLDAFRTSLAAGIRVVSVPTPPVRVSKEN
jgi:hypothetical protein